jgi:hypothetical protein
MKKLTTQHEFPTPALVQLLWHAARHGGNHPIARESVVKHGLVDKLEQALATDEPVPTGPMASDVISWLNGVRAGVQSLQDVGWARGRGNIPGARRRSFAEVDQLGGGKVKIPSAMYFAELVGEALSAGDSFTPAGEAAVLALAKKQNRLPRTVERPLERVRFEFSEIGRPVSAHDFRCARTRHD